MTIEQLTLLLTNTISTARLAVGGAFLNTGLIVVLAIALAIAYFKLFKLRVQLRALDERITLTMYKASKIDRIDFNQQNASSL